MLRTTLAAGLAAATLAAPAAADHHRQALAAQAHEFHQPAVFAYPAHENYCPAGLQPVTINGVVCCGQPNVPLTYTQALTHPVQKRHYAPPKVTHRATASTGIPLKGNDVYYPRGKGID